MSLEQELRALGQVPKPEVDPFFAARVTAHATAATTRPVSLARGEAIYWMALAVFVGPLLLTSWQRVVCLVLVLLAVRFVAAMTVTRRPQARTAQRTPRSGTT